MCLELVMVHCFSFFYKIITLFYYSLIPDCFITSMQLSWHGLHIIVQKLLIHENFPSKFFSCPIFFRSQKMLLKDLTWYRNFAYI